MTGTHSNGKSINIAINNAGLVGNPAEPYYTNTAPVASTVKVLPNTVTGTAGKWY